MPIRFFRKTIRGENLVGKIANKLLPFPKVRKAIGAAITGTKYGLPLPEFKASDVEIAANEALSELEKDNPEAITHEQLIAKINHIRDILDNGKVDGSISPLDPKIVKVIQKGFSALPIVAYLIYSLTTGDFSLSDLLDF